MNALSWEFTSRNLYNYSGNVTTTNSAFPSNSASTPLREPVVVEDLVVGKSYVFASVDGSASFIADVVETFTVQGDVFVELFSEDGGHPEIIRLSVYVYEVLEEL